MGGNNCKNLSLRRRSRSRTRVQPVDETSSAKMTQGRSEADHVEDVVCKVSDIQENEMKEFPLGKDGGKILLVKQHGQYYALGTKCTHYSAPLHTGALGEGRIRCPWHGACFNIKNGDIEDFPGMDSLPSYEVTVENDSIKVKAKKSDLESNSRLRTMCPYKPGESSVAVIAGGGPAAAICAETLRQEGFVGKIIMICKEPVLPYDRIKVSKSLNLKVENILLRSQDFYNTYNIETKLGSSATNLDPEKQTLTLCNGDQIRYDYLFLATGSRPRTLDASGKNLNNIFTIRNYVDAEKVNQVLSPDKKVVVLGTGFIGMEVAAYCQGKCESVTIVSKSPIPMKPIFGDEIGSRIRQEFEKKGVKFITDNGISEFLSKENNSQDVSQVKLLDGTIVDADIVVVGIGSDFNTEWLSESGLKMLPNGAIEVNEYLQTNLKNVYAGGDIAHAPIYAAGNVSSSIGHFGLAHYHGKIAALNICKKETPLKSVPFFWTMLFGKGFRYAGFGQAKSVKICGSLEELKFFAFHCDDDKVIAMSSVGRDPIVSDFANLLFEGKSLSRKEIEEDPYKWMRSMPKDLKEQFKNKAPTA